MSSTNRNVSLPHCNPAGKGSSSGHWPPTRPPQARSHQLPLLSPTRMPRKAPKPFLHTHPRSHRLPQEQPCLPHLLLIQQEVCLQPLRPLNVCAVVCPQILPQLLPVYPCTSGPAHGHLHRFSIPLPPSSLGVPRGSPLPPTPPKPWVPPPPPSRPLLPPEIPLFHTVIRKPDK